MRRQKLSPVRLIVFDRGNRTRRCPFPRITRGVIRPHNDYNLALPQAWDRKKSSSTILRLAGDHRQGAPVNDCRVNEGVTTRGPKAEIAKKNHQRQLGLIPILRNLILTSDIAMLVPERPPHRPCTSFRGRRCGNSGIHIRTPSRRFASGKMSSNGPIPLHRSVPTGNWIGPWR